MNPLEVSRTLRAASLGSGKLKIRFREEAVHETDFILDMVNQDLLVITEYDVMRLAAVSVKKLWRDGDDRNVIVELAQSFHDNPVSAEIMFLGRMTRALEAIEIVA
ncbi:MAG: hypothetical protein AAB407_00610 [Patescibacteria group bacterium]